MSKRVVCITGGYGKLGRELAAAFAARDFQVIITGRDINTLTELADALKCECYRHDVTDIEQTEGLRDYIDKEFGKLDVLVNNAGATTVGHVSKIEPAAFLEVIRTNIFGPYLAVHILLPLIKKSPSPLIINIASTSGHRADPGTSAYNASKFGLIGFTESIRKDLRQFNIRVTSISPSYIQFGEPAAEQGEGVGLNGKDIAQAAVFLAETPGRALYRDIEIWATNP